MVKNAGNIITHDRVAMALLLVLANSVNIHQSGVGEKWGACPITALLIDD